MSEGILPARSIDRRLMRAAASFNKTPQELSDAVGGQLTPSQAVERLHSLLTEVTILDEVQERRLLLVQMAEHLEWMRTKRDDPKSWNALTRTFKLVSDQIERANINIDDVSTKLAAEHARWFVEGYVRGHELALREFAERHDIVVEEDEILELAGLGLKAGEEYIQGVTVRDAV